MLKIGEELKELLINEILEWKVIETTINPGQSRTFPELVGANEVQVLFLGSPTFNRAIVIYTPSLIRKSTLREIHGEYEFRMTFDPDDGKITNDTTSTAPIIKIIYR